MGEEENNGKIEEMSAKILILNRKKSTLEIQDEDDYTYFSYILEITHVEKDKSEFGIKSRTYDIFDGDASKGFVTDVKEVREEW